MAGKDTPPLYEFVHRSDKDSKRAMALPAWMNKDKAAEPTETPAAEAAAKAEAKPHARPVEPQRVIERGHEAAAGEATGARFDVRAMREWVQTTVAFRLPRLTLLLLGLGAVVALMIVFMVGQKLGRRSAMTAESDYQTAVTPITQLQERPAKPLIPTTVTGVERDVALERDGSPAPPRDAGAAGSADDPREPGMNYFRLVVLPAEADEARRIVDYLATNGVDAAAIPVNNSRSVKIMALKAFSKPLSDPEAQRYQQRLGQLGRKWKAEHRGSSDWKDMLPEKYRPGRT